jgi:hypothetical protein
VAIRVEDATPGVNEMRPRSRNFMMKGYGCMIRFLVHLRFFFAVFPCCPPENFKSDTSVLGY